MSETFLSFQVWIFFPANNGFSHVAITEGYHVSLRKVFFNVFLGHSDLKCDQENNLI